MIVFLLCGQILQKIGNKNDAAIVLKKNILTLIIYIFKLYITHIRILYPCMSFQKKIIYELMHLSYSSHVMMSDI